MNENLLDIKDIINSLYSSVNSWEANPRFHTRLVGNCILVSETIGNKQNVWKIEISKKEEK